jgi:hypothetical protein
MLASDYLIINEDVNGHVTTSNPTTASIMNVILMKPKLFP